MDQRDDTTANSRPTDSTVPNAPSINPVALDPFDLGRLRLSQDFTQGLNVKKTLTNIPVKKPEKTWWVQTHPDEAYRLPTMVLELKADGETYLVAPELHPHLMGESAFVPRLLVTGIARPNDVIFIWPIALPGPDGKQNPWHVSAMEAANLSRGRWVRVQANMQAGGYDVMTTDAELPAPKWPDTEFKELLKIAFKGRYVDSLSHPVLRRLRGEL